MGRAARISLWDGPSRPIPSHCVPRRSLERQQLSSTTVLHPALAKSKQASLNKKQETTKYSKPLSPQPLSNSLLTHTYCCYTHRYTELGARPASNPSPNGSAQTTINRSGSLSARIHGGLNARGWRRAVLKTSGRRVAASVQADLQPTNASHPSLSTSPLVSPLRRGRVDHTSRYAGSRSSPSS